MSTQAQVIAKDIGREGSMDIVHGAKRPAREAISDRIWAEARSKAA
jgi:hypothetical protein